jgi:hypothetical protein
MPGPVTQLPNSNYYGLEATIATWTAETTRIVPTIMDLGDVKIMSDKQCAKKCSRMFGSREKIHRRFFCSHAIPYIVLEPVSNYFA